MTYADFSKDATYGTSPTKGRRTKEDIEKLKAALYVIVEEYKPMTVRQVFYQMVSRGFVDKTETEYKSTVVRLLTDMRKSGELPYYWIADNTRWMRKPRTYSDVSQMLQNAYSSYRRALWDNQDAYVEIWLEKEALAGVLVEETSKWDVPLMVTRGYPSLTYLYSAAEHIADQDKPAYLYYFGDQDPSGVDITRNVEETIRERAPLAEIYFQKVAVTPEQIEAWHLPTRPTKKSDTRSRNFDGESVEVDAIEPPVLRDLVQGCILQHIDEDAYNSMRFAENEERERLSQFLQSFRAS